MLKDNGKKTGSSKNGTITVNLSEKYGCSRRTVMVSEEINQAFEDFRKDDEKAKKWAQRHRAGFNFDEIETGMKEGIFQESHEDKASGKADCERIRRILGETSYYRALMYFGYGMTAREIAAIENVSHTAVLKSIRQAELLRTKYTNKR
jgi:hypothetical protein